MFSLDTNSDIESPGQQQFVWNISVKKQQQQQTTNSKQQKQKHMICIDLCLCKCMVVSELCNFAMSEIRFIGIYTDSSMGKISYLRVLFVCLFVF